MFSCLLLVRLFLTIVSASGLPTPLLFASYFNYLGDTMPTETCSFICQLALPLPRLHSLLPSATLRPRASSTLSAPSYPPQMRRASKSQSPSACIENKAREEAKMSLLREMNRGPSLRGGCYKISFLLSTVKPIQLLSQE